MRVLILAYINPCMCKCTYRVATLYMHMHSLVKIENREYPGRYSFIIILDMKTIGLIFGSFSSWTKVVLQFIFVCKEFLYLLMGFSKWCSQHI